jgi:hypothetical protein
MLLYIAATNQVVSSVLVVERAEEGKEHGMQRPVYYLRKVLSPTKQRYPHYQKLAYAIYMTGKKLPHYFECRSIIVVASNPVSSILNNPDAIGRVSLWGVTLGPWEITYQCQSAIKSQVLPHFIAKWTEAQMPKLPDLSNSWTHISRESNEEADNLANIGSRCLPIPPGVFFEEIFKRSVKIKPATDPALATRSGAHQANTTPAEGTKDLPKDAAAVMLVEAFGGSRTWPI